MEESHGLEQEAPSTPMEEVNQDSQSDSDSSSLPSTLSSLESPPKTLSKKVEEFVTTADGAVQSKPQYSELAPTSIRPNDREPSNNCETVAAESQLIRSCPLPALPWANAAEVWQALCKTDEENSRLRSSTMFKLHSDLKPRMRTIQINWLLQICAAHKLHRETFYLAVDFLDRYTHNLQWMPSSFIQLITITCLFLAAKIEELYPPGVREFADTTTGAYNENDILKLEITVLKALNWDVNPVTPISWLGIYLQLNLNNNTPDSFAVHSSRSVSKWMSTETPIIKHNVDNCNICTHSKSSASRNCVDNSILYPHFSSWEYVHTAQLLDLCSLDIGMTDYSYALLAASALCHTFNITIAERLSGLQWSVLEPCYCWMTPFFAIIREESSYFNVLEVNPELAKKHGVGQICPNLITDHSYSIQTYTTTLTMFDRVYKLKQNANESLKALQEQLQSPGTTSYNSCSNNSLTALSSSHNLRESDNGCDGDDESDHVEVTNCNNSDVHNRLAHKRKVESKSDPAKCKKECNHNDSK